MWPWRRQEPDDEETPRCCPIRMSASGRCSRLTRAWQVAALVGWVFAVVPWIVIAHVATQSQIVPHIVEVDPQGHVLYRGPVGSYEIKDVWVDVQLREWIDWVRRRSDDAVLDRRDRERALNMTIGDAHKKLDDYLGRVVKVEQTDGVRNRLRVMVHIRSVVRQSAEHIRMTWQEEWTPLVGTQRTVITLDGTFLIEHRLKKPGLLGQFKIQAKDMERSPLGVFVKFFDWDEVSSTPMAAQ